MAMLRTSLIAASLISLTGCSSLDFRFPWQVGRDREQPVMTDPSNTSDEGGGNAPRKITKVRPDIASVNGTGGCRSCPCFQAGDR